MREDDEQTRALNQLYSMTVHVLRSPPLRIWFPPPPQIPPAALGPLCIGISIALMFFGSIIFVLGLILMPLVITLVFLFYVVGVFSNLSEVGRAILRAAPSSNYYGPAWSYSTYAVGRNH